MRGAALVWLAVLGVCCGDTVFINCPGSSCPFSNIASLVNAATNSTDFVLAPGTYTSCTTNATFPSNMNHSISAPYGAVIDCQGTGPVFISNYTSVAYTNITIRSAIGARTGSAILGVGDRRHNITLVGMTFINNTAWDPTLGGSQPYGYGGALYFQTRGANTGFAVSITNCTFMSNTAAAGGAIFLDGFADGRPNQFTTALPSRYVRFFMSNIVATGNAARTATGTMGNAFGCVSDCPSGSNSGMIQTFGAFLAGLNVVGWADNIVGSNNSPGVGSSGFGYIGFMGSVITIASSTFAAHTGDGPGLYFSGDICATAPYNYAVISNSTFSKQVECKWKGGGAIGGTALKITISGSMFSGCSGNAPGSASGNGGAVSQQNEGGITVIGSTFVSNSAKSTAGAVYGQRVLSISGCVFTGNSAPSGGALASSSSSNPITVVSSNFTQNTASNANEGGGAIMNKASVLVSVSNCVFNSNTAPYGGDVYSPSQVSILNSTFSNSRGLTSGGALCVGNTVTITGNTFSSTSASGNGGAILVITGATVSGTGNTFVNVRSSARGGAIDVTTASLTLSNSSFTGSSATFGADIGVFGTTTVQITGSSFSRPTAGSGGSMYVDGSGTLRVSTSTISDVVASDGAVYINSGSLTVTNVTFQRGLIANQGGGIFIRDKATVTGCTFSSNSALQGGGITITDAATLSLRGCTFSGNTASTAGALYVASVSQAQVYASSFFNNTAIDGSGGAITTAFTATLTVSGTTFTSNTAPLGGAMSLAGSGMFSGTGLTFTNNSAGSDGGAISAVGPMSLSSSTFTQNSAVTNGGGIVMSSNAGATLSGVTFSGNTAVLGAGFSCSACIVDISASSSFQDNHASLGGAYYCSPAAPSTAVNVDLDTTFGGNFASLDPTMQATCTACGCCSYPYPAIMPTATPCVPLPDRSCLYTCDAGYSISQPSGFTCPESLDLKGADMCIPIECPYLTPTWGQRIAQNDTSVTTNRATYSCVTGFLISSTTAAPLTCVGPKWIGTNTSCNIQHCHPLNPIANGAITYERIYEKGETATYSCTLGFTLSGGGKVRNCTFPNWEDSDRFCDAGTCLATQTPDPPLLLDRVSAGPTGSTRNYTCEPGNFIVSGDAYQICYGPDWLTPALLTPEPPKCAPKLCPDFGEVPPFATASNDSLAFGGTITFSCDSGYEMVSGTPTLTCDLPLYNEVQSDDPVWHGTIPTCSPIHCPAIPSPVVMDCLPPYSFLETCRMGCEAGYAGLIIGDYQCTQIAPNEGGNWTLPGTNPGDPRQSAYYPTCDACQIGTYIDALANNDRCTLCENSYTLSIRTTTKADCLCNIGWYEVDPTDPGTCSTCVTGGYCPGGHEPPIAGPGYYQVGSTLQPCNPSSICLGNNTCSEGSMGYLCSQCIKGYYKLNNFCHICPDNSWVLIVVGLVAGAVLVALLIIAARPGAMRERSFGFASIPLFVGFMQMAASFYSFKLPWPTNTRKVFDGFSTFNINVELFSPECVVAFSYYDKIKITLAIPLVLLGLFILGGVAWSAYIFVRDRANFRPKARSVVSKVVAGFLNFMCLAYLLLARAALEPFACQRQLNGDVVLTHSLNDKCLTAEWYATRKFCIFGIVAYIVGVPLTLLAMYFKYRPGDDVILDPLFSFYVSKYSRRAWFYEVVVMSRKLAVVCFAVFIGSQSVLQAVCVIILLFIFSVFTIATRPFRWSKHNMLEVFLLAILVIVIFGGLLMTFSAFEASATADVLIVVFLALSLLATILVFVAELYANINSRLLKRKLQVAPEKVLHSSSGALAAVPLSHQQTLYADEEGLVFMVSHEDKEKDVQPQRIEKIGPVKHLLRAGKFILTVSTDNELYVWIQQHSDSSPLRQISKAKCDDDVRSITAQHGLVAVGTENGQLLLFSLPFDGGVSSGDGKGVKKLSRSSESGSSSQSSDDLSEQQSSSTSASRKSSSVQTGSKSRGGKASGGRTSGRGYSPVHSFKGGNEGKLDLLFTDESLTEPIVAVALARRRVYAATEGTLRIWSLSKSTSDPVPIMDWNLGMLSGGGHVSTMAVSGAQVALALTDHSIHILDERVGKITKVLHSHTGTVTALVPVDRMMLSAARDGVVKLWDTANWRYLQTLGRFTSRVVDVTMHSERVLMALEDGHVYETHIQASWNVDTSKRDLYDNCMPQCCKTGQSRARFFSRSDSGSEDNDVDRTLPTSLSVASSSDDDHSGASDEGRGLTAGRGNARRGQLAFMSQVAAKETGGRQYELTRLISSMRHIYDQQKENVV